MTFKIKDENLIAEHGGFRIGDKVKIICQAIAPDHLGVITKIKFHKDLKQMAFEVDIKSQEIPEGNGEWWPIEISELSKLN